MTTFIASVLLLSSFSILRVTSHLSPLCDAVCWCENDEEEGMVRLDCSRSYLSIVPMVTDWPENATHLDLSTNNITKLDMELSHGSLQVLDLSHNRIRAVTRDAFGGLRSLRYLNLANNEIKELDSKGFYGLEHLKSLNLSSNSLESMPDNVLYHFIGLQELSLSDNRLVHLDPIHFNRMINLRWLDISYIEAYNLAPNIFHTTGQLEFLDLSGNDFNSVPIDSLRSAKNLKHLRLNENPIDTLTKTSFTKLATLEILQLNFMDRLTNVQEQAFSDLTGLRVLELKHNRHLTYLSYKAFDGLFEDPVPVLQEIDLQGNRLSVLKNTIPCARLKKFNLQQNPWICDCMLGWVKECHIQPIYAADLKCASPERIADALIVNLHNDEFKCSFQESEIALQEMHHDRVVRTVSLALGIGVLVIMAFGLALLFKWRDLREWYRDKRKGQGAVYYVRARANPA